MGKRIPTQSKTSKKSSSKKGAPKKPKPEKKDWKNFPLEQLRMLLELELVGSEPSIWRVFHVPADIPLSRLHDVIQLVMGWTDSHLHAFRFGDLEFSPHFEGEENLGEDESEIRLGELIHKEGAVFNYTYDFGDGWEHQIRVAGIRAAEEGDITAFPVVCLDGEGACPPESVGGLPGYEEFCRVLAGEPCEERDERLEWYEGFGFYPTPFDPARWDLGQTNLALARFLSHIRIEPLEWCGEY